MKLYSMVTSHMRRQLNYNSSEYNLQLIHFLEKHHVMAVTLYISKNPLSNSVRCNHYRRSVNAEHLWYKAALTREASLPEIPRNMNLDIL